MFDPELFGQAMGEAIKDAVSPLIARIGELEKRLAERPAVTDEIKAAIDEAVKSIPAPRDGKDADPETVEQMVRAAVSALPPPRDGTSITLEDVMPVIDESVKAIRADLYGHLDAAINSIPAPRDGQDGAGIADLLIDREGVLVATFTDGRMKSLGKVVGTDGRDGADGKDGIGLESFEQEYLPETHEVRIKATCAGRVQETRYPAGGIRSAGYWRDGSSAKACEAWSCDGALWIARVATSAKPDAKSEDWILAARKGRDGERAQKPPEAAPAAPVKLKKDGD